MPIPSYPYSQTYIAAGHPGLTPTDLKQHMGHEHHLIRLRVAEHQNSSPDLLSVLAEDKHPDVRAAIAEHPAASTALVWKLAKDDSADVRYALAENARLEPEILEHLTNDENAYISQRAKQTLRTLSHVHVSSPAPNFAERAHHNSRDNKKTG